MLKIQLPEFGFTKAFQYRSTLSIITTPLNVDFAITVNFIALMTDRLLQVQESERLAEAAKVQEVQRIIDEDLLKAEKAKSIKENKDKQALEQDRLKKEKLETAKARVTATREKLRQKKETITAGLALPAVSSQRTTVTPTKKVRHDEKSRHGWHPQDLTQSKCHPSREVWDAAYCKRFLGIYEYLGLNLLFNRELSQKGGGTQAPSDKQPGSSLCCI